LTHIPVRSLTRAPRARAPAGFFFRRRLRCSAPRKVPLIPRTRPSLDCVALDCVLDPGPPLSRREQGGIVRQEGAQDARPFANVQERASSEPRPALAHSHGFIVRARHRGRRLFGYFFFAVEEKVTRSPRASGSLALEDRNKIKMDSGLLRNDEQRGGSGMTIESNPLQL